MDKFQTVPVKAWNLGSPAEVRKVGFKRILDKAPKILVALKAWNNWVEVGRDTPKFRKLMRPLVELFGYDGYEGRLYRGMNFKSLKGGMPKAGEIIEFRPRHEGIFSAWSASRSVAERFFERAAKRGPAMVITLVGRAHEVVSDPWIAAVSKEISNSMDRYGRTKATNELNSVLGIGPTSFLLKLVGQLQSPSRFYMKEREVILMSEEVEVKVMKISTATPAPPKKKPMSLKKKPSPFSMGPKKKPSSFSM